MRDPLDIMRVQQRLNYLGYTGAGAKVLKLDGLLGENTKHAIGVFNSAVAGTDKATPSAQPNVSALNSSLAPR